MKKIILLTGIALLMSACAEHWNDMVHYEVKASIVSFKVEGQVDCIINSSDKKIEVILPWYADPTALKVTEFDYTESAVCNPAIKAGDILDLSEPVSVTLSTYDDYVWTLMATLKPKPSDDLYNMTFDLWSKDIYGLDTPWEAESALDQRFWSSPTLYLGLFGYPLSFQESEFVAVGGEGKYALKLQTRSISEMGGIVMDGCIFTGSYKEFDFTTQTASFGTPFIKRPNAMEGFACYKPKEADNAVVFVALADWDAPYELSPLLKIVDDIESIPGVIGYGKKIFSTEMTGYEDFTIDIKYLNDNTPKYVVVYASPSYKTPVGDSVLYLDELGFTY